MGYEPYIGEIVLFAGNYEPRGWRFCHGQTLSIAQNTALFSILGTTYGGNGTTTFQLPDLRGRVPVCAGQGPGLSDWQLGQAAGSETVTLTDKQLPVHTHGVGLTVGNAAGGTAIAGVSGGTAGNVVQTAPAGASVPVPLTPPSLGINFIIAIEGIYPSRS
jgi:microcystin-dependent protein